MDKITKENFDLAINYLQINGVEDIDGQRLYRLPYDFFPGQSSNGTTIPLNTKAAWDAYIWNPPEFDYQHDEGDSGCLGKPTWEALVSYAIAARRNQAIARLRKAAQRRITAGYGEQTPQDEMFTRLRAMQPDLPPNLTATITAGDTERDRLLTRYQTLKTWIHTLTDLDQLTHLDFTTPTYWSPNWTPPT